MRPQAEFWICCTVLSPLQNGKKKVKKKGRTRGENSLTMLTNYILFIMKGRGALIDEIGPLSKVRILHQKLSILMSEVYYRSNYTVTVYLSYARADRKAVIV